MVNKNSVREWVIDDDVHYEIDATGYEKLEKLVCSARGCEFLNLSKNTNLLELDCSNNSLEELKLLHCESIQHVDCCFNILKTLELPDISDLVFLDCSNNCLESLDLSGAPDLKELYCDDNIELSSIRFPTIGEERISMDFIDLSSTNLDIQWLKSPYTNFPIPSKGKESEILLNDTPLAEDAGALQYIKSLGWEIDEQ